MNIKKQLPYLLLLSLFLIYCDNDALQKDQPQLTRLYVQNDLDGFFRLIRPLTIRKNGTTTWSADLLTATNGEQSYLTEEDIFKHNFEECDDYFDIRAEVSNNQQPAEEIFEFINIYIACGEDYKWVLKEPTPSTPPYTDEGCMQTSSSKTKELDTRTTGLCGEGS